MKRFIVLLLGPCIVISLLTSCATIALDSSTLLEPVQMNAAGTLDFTVIDSFSVNDKAGWIFGLVPVNKPAGDGHDYLKSILKAQIEEVQGDAVINLKLRTQIQFLDFLTWLVPFYTTRTVTITGDVIIYD